MHTLKRSIYLLCKPLCIFKNIFLSLCLSVCSLSFPSVSLSVYFNISFSIIFSDESYCRPFVRTRNIYIIYIFSLAKTQKTYLVRYFGTLLVRQYIYPRPGQQIAWINKRVIKSNRVLPLHNTLICLKISGADKICVHGHCGTPWCRCLLDWFIIHRNLTIFIWPWKQFFWSQEYRKNRRSRRNRTQLYIHPYRKELYFVFDRELELGPSILLMYEVKARVVSRFDPILQIVKNQRAYLAAI